MSRIFTTRSSVKFITAYHEVWDSSEMESVLHNLDADEHLSYFNSNCASILNSIAPLKLRNHKSEPVFWHNETTRSLRQACRQAECKWKKDKLQVSYEIMRNSLTMFQRAAKAAKCKYFSDLITKNRHKSRVLFSTIDSALNPPVKLFPEPSVFLCESFGKFFTTRSWLLDLRCLILVILCLMFLYIPPHGLCLSHSTCTPVRKLWIILSLHHVLKI